MTLLDDLQEKLSEAQNQVQQATAELNGFSEVKTSLQSADGQMRAAASKLDELSSSLNNGAAALEKAATSLADTNDIIRKTDPAEILKELAAISSRQKSLEKNLSSSVKELSDETDTALNELRDNIRSSVRDGVKGLETKIYTTAEQDGSRTRALVTGSTKLIPIIIGATVINTALLIALASKFFM